MLSLYALFVAVNGPWLAGFFLGFPNETTESFATGQAVVKIVGIMALCLPFLAMFSVTSGALRGAGDTTWPLLITIIGFLLIRVPLAYWLSWQEFTIPGTSYIVTGMNWGLTGAWMAMLIDTLVRAALILARYWHGAWKRIEV